MAHVTLSPLISSLSGTIGDMTFRTRNGKTSVFQKNPPRLPANATRKQKAQYKKQLIVDQCIKILQDEIGDILIAIERRHAIKQKVEYWYDKFAQKIKAPTKLQGEILSRVRQSTAKADDPVVIKATDASALPQKTSQFFGDPEKGTPENVSRLDRDFLENGSEKLQKNIATGVKGDPINQKDLSGTPARREQNPKESLSADSRDNKRKVR